MFVGFDYGTSNCALGVIDQGKVNLLPMDNDSRYLSSTLYSFHRDLVTASVARDMPAGAEKNSFVKLRNLVLSRAGRIKNELDLDDSESRCLVGQEAISAYLDEPGEGYFVKSPKSFLGAKGLMPAQIALFEDIVTAMMMAVKQAGESHLQREINQAVIGRPVNFQGRGGEDSNQQAERILQQAARRAGFKQTELLFEPLAAGIDFETTLKQDQTVLVVDVGGGTTDCSVVKMGPSYINKALRQDDFLGHSGKRVGGNDLDIHLSLKALMPLCGFGGLMKSGLPMPSQPFWNAVSINDIGAQSDFHSRQSQEQIKRLVEDAEFPEQLQRLLTIQEQRLSYQLVRAGEQSKIALTDNPSYHAPLPFLGDEISQAIDRQLLAEAIARPLGEIIKLMNEALLQAQCRPDVIYVTGGTAKSPVISAAIKATFTDTPIVIGDHFGSVTGGLTKWASKIFA